MQKLLYILNSLAAVLLIFAYISPFVDPAITLFFSIFGLFYPVILFINISFVLLWLVLKPSRALLSGLLIALGTGALTRTVGLGSDEPGEGISVMTYNIGKTRVDFSRVDKDLHIAAFKNFLEKQSPDILCVQERTKWHLDIYKDIFRKYAVYPDTELGTAIYSKFPILDGGNLPFESMFHNATWADIETEQGTIRFYAVHLSSNRITQTTAEMLKNPDLGNSKIWGDLKFIFSRYNHHSRVRSDQVDELLNHARNAPYPVVISGDFNDVPQSYIYRKICSVYKDAFTEAGTGIVKTFISSMPALRIDYTFVSEEIRVLDHYIVKSRLSDHYPVVSIIDPLN